MVRYFRVIRRLSVLLLFALPLLVGCTVGESGLTVSGAVTLDGKPVEDGVQLVFKTVDSRVICTGYTQEGNYQLKYAGNILIPKEDYLVTVFPFSDDKEPTDDLLGRKQAVVAQPDVKTKIPKKYQSTKTSGLVFSLQEGKNLVPIELSSH